jgi:hypothetical protein
MTKCVEQTARFLTAAILCAACVSLAAEGTAPAAPQPRCSVKEARFDAGRVAKGEPLTHDFVLENLGGAALEITAKPSCGCTVTKYDSTIRPGETGKISATLTTSALGGPVQKFITVTTNDPQMPSFQLTLAADVRAALNVEPPGSQSFGLVFRGQSPEKEFTITSEDGAPFEVTSVQSEDPALKFELGPTPDKKSLRFKVTLPADHPAGPISGRFTLGTTHPKAPSVTVGVFGTVREACSVAPSEVHFPGVSKTWAQDHPDDASLQKNIDLTDEQGPGLEVKSAASTLACLDVAVRELEPKKRFSVELRLKPSARTGDFAGEVEILTNQKSFKVPVTGNFF